MSEIVIKLDDIQPGTVYKKTVNPSVKAQKMIIFESETDDKTFKYTEDKKNILISVYKKVEGSDDILIAQVTVKNYLKKSNYKDVLVKENEFGQKNLREETYELLPSKDTFAGSWANEKSTSTSADEMIKMGGGRNEITFEKIEKTGSYAGFGKDTFVSKGEDDILTFDEGYYGNITLSRVGNDVLLGTKQTVDETEISGSVLIKDYLKKKGQTIKVGSTDNDIEKKDLQTLIEDEANRETMALKDSSSKGNSKLTGSWLGEDIYGGVGNNKITTGVGADNVYISAGKDTLTIDGVGDKTFNMTSGTVSGETSISFKSDVPLKETKEIKEIAKLDLKYSATENSELIFEKSGNTLILTQNTTVEETKNSAKVVLSDYFNTSKGISGVVSFNGGTFENVMEHNSLYQFGQAKKSNNMNDTVYDDMLIGGNKADKITVSNKGSDGVNAGAGNDTLTITKDATGTKDLIFNKGDGRDFVNFDAKSTSKVKISNNYMLNGGSVAYSKTGDDLIVTSTYLSENSKTVVDTITLNDYFKTTDVYTFKYEKTPATEETPAVYDYRTLANELGSEGYITVNGVVDKNKKSLTYKETVYEGSNLKDSMTYLGKGSADMYGGEGNDIYNVSLTNKSNLYIEDNKGVNILNMEFAGDNVRVLFNADKNGYALTHTEGEVVIFTDNLSVYTKDTFTSKNIKKSLGQLEIADGFVSKTVEEETTVSLTDKYSFKVKNGESYDVFNMSEYVDTIKSAVVGWFNAHNDYVDTVDVLTNGKTADINELLTVYSTGTYQA